MAKILGLGGVFLKCADPDAYNQWWKTSMGVDVSEWGGLEWPCDGKAMTMVTAFDLGSDYFAPSSCQFMINLRVDDVAGMLEKARAGGVKILGEISDEGYGVFGWFLDPLGIKIELWQEKS